MFQSPDNSYLRSIDLSLMVKESRKVRLDFSPANLELSIPGECFDRRGEYSFWSAEEDSVRKFNLDVAVAVENFNEDYRDVLASTGLLMEIFNGKFEFSYLTVSTPALAIFSPPRFEEYVRALSDGNPKLTQLVALKRVLKALYGRVDEAMSRGDKAVSNEFNQGMWLVEVRDALRNHQSPILKDVLPSFEVLAWLLRTQCYDHVFRLVEVGALSLSNLVLHDDELKIVDVDAVTPMHFLHVYSEDSDRFRISWQRVAKALEECSDQKQLSPVVSVVKDNARRALNQSLLDIVPHSSALDDPGVDARFRAVIVEYLDFFKEPNS